MAENDRTLSYPNIRCRRSVTTEPSLTGENVREGGLLTS